MYDDTFSIINLFTWKTEIFIIFYFELNFNKQMCGNFKQLHHVWKKVRNLSSESSEFALRHSILCRWGMGFKWIYIEQYMVTLQCTYNKVHYRVLKMKYTAKYLQWSILQHTYQLVHWFLKNEFWPLDWRRR